ncbi:MAG: serine/threonine protein phosphatase [Corynebacterium sp.]|uniref:metallophosphoesterase n=1 Tax=Corynebacterium sp. TaxID=1720 RepID=UPI0026DD61C8|nr:metallophosphoesterase [Corynebacterium sp.]MDO4760780.1 serine/threonine protein phosphatase [Corynebacterium sp.]
MRDFYISDPHFGHTLVSELRGFRSPRAHDRALFEAWMDELPADENIRLWILGDNSCGTEEDEDYALGQLQRLRENLLVKKNSRLALHGIVGNHDSIHPMSTKSYKRLPTFLQVYDTIQLAASTKMAGMRVMLSHFPYTGDQFDTDRMEQFRLRDLGQPLVHGHTHNKEIISYSAQGSLQLCVCVDACEGMRPMEKETLDKLIHAHLKQ